MNIHEYQQLLENKKHTGDSFPYNTYLCTIPLDFSNVPTHWHDDFEFIVIKKGAGTVHVDLVEYPVFAGDVIIVLPGKLHSIEEKKGYTMEYENIIFRGDFLLSKHEDVCSQAFLIPLMQGHLTTDCHIHSSLSYYTDFTTIISSIDLLSHDRPTGFQLAVKGYLYQLFFLLISNQHKDIPNPTGQKNLDKVKLVIKYIEEHYAEPITLSQMAELCHYSDSHFMKFFRQQMKDSFVHYLNEYRLTMAARLLTTTSCSVLEIAAMVGFDNLSYFNRLFKKRYGVTPRQMR
ncbi:AraC family transcriptional regulator [Hespellia stercorisuis]|uniref:AraC-type DNA-binding protein n=1 Tax=Hespellia stercorisuis DSM 15480 TaxID=1121950 RepID=A0A1M6U9I6_9FIRM|nr:AraC family transcriptional regulator [Hespellia stercorisuis]SHK65847.1 AraC-type DNA-binding protein [Hespellia stercorisuis DSM 15480]